MHDLDVGLIGSGSGARARLAAWLTLGARIRLYSPDGLQHRLAAAHSLHRVTAVGSLRQLLTPSSLVDVCVPVHGRYPLVRAAVRAGYDLVCELPTAPDPDEARRAADAADAAGVHLFPAAFDRWSTAHASLCRVLADRPAGPGTVLEFSRSAACPVRSRWFAGRGDGAGRILLEQSVHDFDRARALAGEVVRVRAECHESEQGLPTAAATTVLTHASGAVSRVLGRWGLPGTVTRSTVRLSGPGGLSWQHDSGPAPDGASTAAGHPLVLLPEEHPTVAGLRAFAVATTTGRPAGITARDGVAAARIAAAARLSARTGRDVDPSAGD
ncbi:Gfo/Idh/MocA family protein [Kitasatospora cineracea]|uniref:Myo-inositol 2-dehydrogenase/D-chiro-inositol 1-dehydrogenase n=1 Tax=Kitasatospora cineracea TaxID=88074 RepID=A0A8G1XE05_9ACTN|nr:Gfo/Idh/MocA family oxidoreductase [Kitasatospora cineracea]ROR46414.1 myo-inositol 2-dehydrogenase/D-chiro-inositol 1-dehydrogenase [Kitasatospora cineracea]